MAQLLQRKLFFPCARRQSQRSLMAANTGAAAGPSSRIVAFETCDEAHGAIRRCRHAPLQLVIGPKLSYTIDSIGAVDTEVWNASAQDVVDCGVRNFFLDVCTFPGDGSLTVTSSYNIVVDATGSDVERLNGCWRAR